MKKTILITGSTDGIGLETAKRLAREGHNVLIHGRNQAKLQEVEAMLQGLVNEGSLESYIADLSSLKDVQKFAKEVASKHTKLDVLINNAGVYNISDIKSIDGLDKRFVVNTIAPYLLSKLLKPLFIESSRIVNLSSAAQAPINLDALKSLHVEISNSEAYAQSKLAITMWSNAMAKELKDKGIVVVSINPKSFLGSKMVKEAYGISGSDLSVGADILCRAALSDEFADANGKYFDNDIGKFSQPYLDALDDKKCQDLVNTIEDILIRKL